jgi:uncharacterized protein (TIGR04141 family)
MTSVNALDPDQLTTLDTNNIDLVTRQQRTHLSVGSPVSEFGLDVNVDWIRKISGKPTSKSVAKSVSGADPIVINSECNLETLGEKCAQLLELFESDAYKDKLSFIDQLQPLNRKDPVVGRLDAELKRRLDLQSHDRIAIAYPELPDEEQLAVYKIWKQRSNSELEEISLGSVYDFFNVYPDVPRDPSQVHVIGLDGNDEPVTHKRSLRDYLVCEIEWEGKTYVLSIGQWFRVNGDYVAKVRESVAEVDDLTEVLDLPPAKYGEREASYNTRVAEEKGWLLMDKANIRIGGSYDKVEVCDVMSGDFHLLCVKKMNRSSTLSHLFAQGSVSATLLRESSEYRDAMNGLVNAKWAGKALSVERLPSVVFVFGIPTDKTGPLSSCMFFFSQVNLLNHVKAIRRVGCRAALCKIEYDPVRPKQRKGMRQRGISSGSRLASSTTRRS